MAQLLEKEFFKIAALLSMALAVFDWLSSDSRIRVRRKSWGCGEVASGPEEPCPLLCSAIPQLLWLLALSLDTGLSLRVLVSWWELLSR